MMSLEQCLGQCELVREKNSQIWAKLDSKLNRLEDISGGRQEGQKMAKDSCLAAILGFEKKLNEAERDVSELPYSAVSEVAKTDQQCLIKKDQRSKANLDFLSNIEARCLALTKRHKELSNSMNIVKEAGCDFKTQIVEIKKRTDEALRVKLPGKIATMSAMSYPPPNMSAKSRPPLNIKQPPQSHLSTPFLKNPNPNSQSVLRPPFSVFLHPRNEVQSQTISLQNLSPSCFMPKDDVLPHAQSKKRSTGIQRATAHNRC